MPTSRMNIAPSSSNYKDLPATYKLRKLEMSQIVGVLSSQYGVTAPHDCHSVKGNENHFEGRYRISQSHGTALKSLLSTSLIIIGVDMLMCSINHFLLIGDHRVINTRRC